MMTQAFLKRLGVLGISIGLTMSPLAFAEQADTEEFDTSADRMENGEAETATNGDEAEDYPGTEGEEITPDANEAGAPGVDGAEGTQSGEAPQSQ